MKSIKYIFKTSYGPSSSHTMGPAYACERFLKENYDCDSFNVILYGSLAKTGKGHGTDTVIRKCFESKKVDIIFDTKTDNLPHPNTLDMLSFKDGQQISRVRVMSVGGGSTEYENGRTITEDDNTSFDCFHSIAEVCKEKSISLWEYVKIPRVKILRIICSPFGQI